MGRHLGLIIGVNQYQDSTFQPLQFAENDARAIAQWLVNNKGGQWSPPDVQLVQGAYASRELVQSLISQICLQKADRDDVILLYFAGHAFVDERTGEGFLAFSNSRYRDTATCLSLLALTQQIFSRSQAANVLFILDCFQTGQPWNQRRTTPYDSKPLLGNALSVLQQQKNRLFLCSCRGNVANPESGEKILGLFTHRLVLGLSGPARESASGNTTLSKLHGYLFQSLSEQHRPQLFGQQQTPYVIVGDLAASNPQTAPESGSGVFRTSTPAPNMNNAPTNVATETRPHTSGLFKYAASVNTGAMSPTSSSQEGPSTSGILRASAIHQPGLQQSQQLVEQAQQLFQAQNFKEAFDLVEKALVLSPQFADALILKGQLLGTAGRYAEAVAVVDQLLQADAQNALGWSMRAVALSNMGQYQPALEAIERSLEIDANNTESYAIKTNIMSMTAAQSAENQPAATPTYAATALKQTEKPQPFALTLGMQVLGLLSGVIGSALLLVLQGFPLAIVGLLIASLGLALLCVMSLRGAYHHGMKSLGLTIVISILIVAALGGTYKVGMTKLTGLLNSSPNAAIPLLFLVCLLAGAALIPALCSIGGFVGGIKHRGQH